MCFNARGARGTPVDIHTYWYRVIQGRINSLKNDKARTGRGEAEEVGNKSGGLFTYCGTDFLPSRYARCGWFKGSKCFGMIAEYSTLWG